jgi:hypothetical protein
MSNDKYNDKSKSVSGEQKQEKKMNRAEAMKRIALLAGGAGLATTAVLGSTRAKAEGKFDLSPTGKKIGGLIGYSSYMRYSSSSTHYNSSYTSHYTRAVPYERSTSYHSSGGYHSAYYGSWGYKA